VRTLLAALTLLIAVSLPEPAPAPCVPLTAVDYDGTRNLWVDIDGRPVAFALEEDTLDWCTS